MRGGASRERFWSDLRSSLSGQASGAAALFVTSADALAGNRAARDELVAVAKQSWRVWEPFVELWHQLDDDRGGLAAGTSLGVIAGRGITALRPSGGSGRHLVAEVGIARHEAVQEGRLRHLLSVIGVTTRPYVPGDSRLGLYAHEAMNGHAIRQHVAKALAFLRWRADHLGSASTFPDAMTAQRALDRVRATYEDELRALMEGEVGDYLPVKVEMDETVGHGYVRGDPRLQLSRIVRGGFQRVDGGIMLVSLYPKV